MVSWMENVFHWELWKTKFALTLQLSSLLIFPLLAPVKDIGTRTQEGNN